MIVLLNDTIRRFAKFISDKHVSPVELYVVPGYDALEFDDGTDDKTVAFGAYDPENKRIIVPEGITDEDKKLILSTIAHEYFHHIEKDGGFPHHEVAAEKYANDMVKAFEERENRRRGRL